MQIMRKVKKYWKCRICGDLHYGVAAPEKCPTCGHPRADSAEITKDECIKLLK